MNCANAVTMPFVWLLMSLVLNEVLYDPPGSDGGNEFVELLCTGPEECELDGIQLEFLNGGDLERPRLIWSGSGQASLPPGGRLVLGEPSVAAADTQLGLSLQNGPDALRLTRGEAVIDAVAWGELPGVGEGAPAPDVSSAALARVPDGFDSGDNASDFHARPPTPGAPNSFADDVELLSLRSTPGWLPRDGIATISAEIGFTGDDAIQYASLSLRMDDGPESHHELRGEYGSTVVVQQEFSLGAGAHECIAIGRAADAPPDSLRLPLHVGSAALRLSEILPAPRKPEPEWIELRSDGRAAGVWSVADRASEPRAFQLDGTTLQSEFVLLAQDCAGLRAFRTIPDEVACLELVGGWPALNNGPSEADGSADRIRLFDAHGAIVDEFEYGFSGTVPTGHSFERSDAGGAWLLSPGEPTPGSPNGVSLARLPKSGLAASPEIFIPDEGELQIVLRPGEGLLRIESRIVDLRGETVIELGSGVGDGAYLRWSWNGLDARGRPLPWGAYVALVRAQSESGAPRRWRSLFALGARP